MKYNYLIVPITISLIGLFSCKEDAVVELNPTELEVTVLDENGNIVSDAEVRLFRNRRDWESLTREVDIKMTDSYSLSWWIEGEVAFFTDLHSANFFIYASYYKGNTLVSNQYLDEDGYITGSNYELADYLVENAVTRVSVSALNEKPLNYSSFTIKRIEQFYWFDDPLIEVNSDTTNYSILLCKNFDWDTSINNQPEVIIDDFNSSMLFDQTSQKTGALTQHYPINEFEISIADFENVNNYYEILLFEIDSESGTIADSPDHTIELGEEFLVQPFHHRIKTDKLFYGNDTHLIDLIIEWN